MSDNMLLPCLIHKLANWHTSVAKQIFFQQVVERRQAPSRHGILIKSFCLKRTQDTLLFFTATCFIQRADDPLKPRSKWLRHVPTSFVSVSGIDAQTLSDLAAQNIPATFRARHAALLQHFSLYFLNRIAREAQ